MELKEMIGEIQDQVTRLRKAKATGVTVNYEKERLKNVLFNHADEILEAMAMADEAEEKIKILNLQLDDSEKDLADVEKELKELKAKTAVKPKNKAGANGEQE